MSASRLPGLRAAPVVLALLVPSALITGCGDPQDKGPGPRPIGSIAPAAARAESAGTDAVPQRHRGKLPAAIEEPPGSDEDEGGGTPVAPHKPPPGGSTL